MHASMARKPEVSHKPLSLPQRVLQYDACCLQQPIRCRQTCGAQPTCPTPVIHPRDSAVCPKWTVPPTPTPPVLDSLVGSTAVRGRRRRTFIFMRRGVSALTRGLKAVLRITSTQ